jgi:GT2 family glycosyltransferase
MSNKKKIGVGVITCNRPHFVTPLVQSLVNNPFISHLTVVNDGDELSEDFHQILKQVTLKTEYEKNPINVGSGMTKNRAMQSLLRNDCTDIFIIEDDMVILDDTVFLQYVAASTHTGIQHFNYGPGSPFNRKQTIQNYDLHNRHLLETDSEPNPKLIVEYKNNINIALYEHTVAMFSYFTKEVLATVGLINTDSFRSAFDHVEHTYRIIKAGFHPPFWWFADLANSHELLKEAPNAIKDSVIAKDETAWMKEVHDAREMYLRIHGHYPNNPPLQTEESVIQFLKQCKTKS